MSLRLDRNAFNVTSLSDDSSEKEYWLSKTPYERLRAVEFLRQTIYGYRPSASRLQRVLDVAQRSQS